MFLIMALQPLMETWILLWFPLRTEGVLEQILSLFWASVSQYCKWWQLLQTFSDYYVPQEPDKEGEKFPRRGWEVMPSRWLVLKAQIFLPQKSREPRWRSKRVSSVFVPLASSFNGLLFWSSRMATKTLPGWVSVPTSLQSESIVHSYSV